MSGPTRVRLAALLAAVMAMTLAGCGLGTAGGFTPSGQLRGRLADVEPLDGLNIAVGSKNFTEQLVLGKMAVILLKSAGASVEDFTNIPGSSAARQAQLQGEIDMEWEYTGTAWIEYMGHDNPIPQSHKQYEAVRKEDLAKNGLVWLPPAPMNNTYGMATPSENAKKLGVSKLSDLAKLPKSERTFCVESEFASRNDGLEGMLKAYGVPLGQGVPRSNLKTLATGAIYAATDRGACNFGEVFTTDGRIKALDLTVLQDDRHFFPIYNVCPVILKQTLADYPQLRELFAPVVAKLNNKTLVNLNAQVDVDGRKPADVAFDWLKREGFLQ